MTENSGELWAIGSEGQIFTENGRRVAQFFNPEEAQSVVDYHNLEVELNEPEPPEVVKTREVERADRLKQWREHDPTGYRLHELVISALQRSMNFLSLRAPEFLIAQQIDQAAERIKALQEMHPILEEDKELS